jgi:REP element-mobilizing transposase RayT
MNRGDHREPVFRDDRDREAFVETLGEACAKTGWEVHAYCLMPNHFHLVVETPQGNLVAGMKWLLGTYTVKGDQGKVAMAVRLRRETPMTLKWVAERLAMGSWSNVSNLLALARKKGQ